LGKKEITDVSAKDIDKSTPEYKYIEETIKSYPVVMFSKPTCSFCKMARELLDGISVKYQLEDISTKDNCQAIQEVFRGMTGESTVPRVFIGGKCVGGGSEVWTLHNQGRLVPMLKEASAIFTSGDKKSN